MTSFERIDAILHGRPADRIGIFEGFWDETYDRWKKEGHVPSNGQLPKGHFLNRVFDHDIIGTWPFPLDLMLTPKFTPKTLKEDERFWVFEDGNRATQRILKDVSGSPEYVSFYVDDRERWDEVKSALTPTDDRLDRETYRERRQYAKTHDKYFMLQGRAIFESMFPLCGHENLLAGMALDPDWVSEMVYTYSHLITDLLERLFTLEGKPDALMFCDDLGYKNTPFFSPKMFDDLMRPGYQHLFQFAHSHDLPVIMHSCGFIEPLLPGLVECGLDCLQAIERKAGMDPVRIYKRFQGKLVLMGGINATVLATNDSSSIDRELESTIPFISAHNRYILHSDHSIPPEMDYQQYVRFMEKAISLGGKEDVLHEQ